MIRLLQLVGLFAIARDCRAWPVLTLLLWVGFMLGICGPVVSPK